MTILVTGSSGLVGSAVIERLVNKRLPVVGYDLSKESGGFETCKYEQGDLGDFSRLASIIQRYEVSAIVHCGGFSHPQVGTESPYQIVQTNIVGTTNVFEAARLFKLKKVIYLSSGAVYGDSQAEVMREDDKLTPTTIYGVTKITGEHLAELYSMKYGIDMISLRLAFVYGPRRSMPDPIKSLLERAIRGENINDETGIEQKLEFIYVKDAARAIEIALNPVNLSKNVFNIGSGVNNTMKDVTQTIRKLFPNIEIEMGKGDLGYSMRGPFDCSRAKEVLNFSSLYSLEEGISDYLEYLKQRVT